MDLAFFALRKSASAALTLAAIIVIIMIMLQLSVCAQFQAKVAEIRSQIAQEIVEKHLTFSSVEERTAFIEKRIRQEITRQGLEICS